MDKVEIEILENGLIKMSTDKVSMPNHGNCEMFLREMVKLAGGEASRKGKRGALTHTHDGNTHTH